MTKCSLINLSITVYVAVIAIIFLFTQLCEFCMQRNDTIISFLPDNMYICFKDNGNR